jgi:hypothetical protein
MSVAQPDAVLGRRETIAAARNAPSVTRPVEAEASADRQALAAVVPPRRLLSAVAWMLEHAEPVDQQVWAEIYQIMRTAPSRRTRLIAARIFADRLDPVPRSPVLVNAPTVVTVHWAQDPSIDHPASADELPG